MEIPDVQGKTFAPTTCLLPMITPFSVSLMKLHKVFEGGIMPVSGGYYDQPNLILEALAVITQRQTYLRQTRNEHPE